MDAHNPQVTAASVQGKRPYQEDRWVVERVSTRPFTGHLLAVFDGHGGAATAEDAARSIAPLFIEALKSLSVAEALVDVVSQLVERTRSHDSGSTLSAVAISSDGEAHVATLGDSPVAWLKGDGEIGSARSHNVRENPDELRVAIARGAVFEQGYIFDRAHLEWGVQMSRALGDTSLERVLDRTPSTYYIRDCALLLVGSDGLLDPMRSTAEQLQTMMRNAREGETSQQLVADAANRHSSDNATAIIWRAAL